MATSQRQRQRRSSSSLFQFQDSQESQQNNNKTDTETITTTTTTTTTTTSQPQFGDVVPLKRPVSISPPNNNNNNNNDYDNDIMLSQSQSPSFFKTPTVNENDDDYTTTSTTKASPSSSSSSFLQSSTSTTEEVNKLIQQRQRRNISVAILSVALAVVNYLWQWTHPVTPIQLLVGLQQTSTPLHEIGRNNKPTLMDFWAPWCENCKSMAPTLYQIEETYRDKVNFVMVNGDDPNNWPLIEKLGVDAIPHLALIEADGTVDTALIGPVPKEWLTRDLDVLIENANKMIKNNDRRNSNDNDIITTNNNNNSDTTKDCPKTTTAATTATATTTSSSTQQVLLLCEASDTTIDAKKPLPYQMLDVFAHKPAQERNIAGNLLGEGGRR
ncbi:thioredoxin domain containing protein [Nitzschia inconspicua]|uniref:Thioredoxin domain containing protein n=1 Tax=Nitzschia inconspicua TaxID=303405 RepID=A0A9K3KK80_9STRA|nr:thioredoxin domain containing protein [Nitzschia inconspicua]